MRYLTILTAMRGVTQSKKDADSKKGQLAADEFVSFIEKKYGGSFKKASQRADMFDHIDYEYTTPAGKVVTLDFKSLKYVAKPVDDDSDEDAFNIVELTAVDGSKGWLFGKADFICFETTDSWLWVPRLKLVTFINANVKDEEPMVGLKCSTDLYMRKYQRANRKDVITVVKKDELINLSTNIVKK
jgi:hypothetical protein